MDGKIMLGMMTILAKGVGEETTLEQLKEELTNYLLLPEESRKERKHHLRLALQLASLAIDDRNLEEMLTDGELFGQATKIVDRLKGGN